MPWGRDEPPARRAPAATLALMATEDSRTPRPRHTPTPTSARPRCDNPDCSHAAYVLAHDSHHYCPSCFHRRTAVWRRENRERGLCACGQAPTENYKTCHRCRNRSALRIRRWRLRQQYGPPTHGWYTVDANTASVTPSRAKKRRGDRGRTRPPRDRFRAAWARRTARGAGATRRGDDRSEPDPLRVRLYCLCRYHPALRRRWQPSPGAGLAGRDGARGAIREGAGAADGGRGAGRGVGRAAVG